MRRRPGRRDDPLLGTAAVERPVAAQGELASLRTFCQRLAQRQRTREQQLRRFMGTRSGRKAHYGRVLADGLDPTQVPRPLDRVLPGSEEEAAKC